MVIIKDEEGQEKGMCTIVTYHRRRCRLGQQSEYIPNEIWLEILSRLPIKSLLIFQSVCKSWRKIAYHLKNKININQQSIPLCGLLLRSDSLEGVAPQRGAHMSYICLRTKKIIDMQTESPDHKLTVSSGYESRLLGNLCFDFTAIGTVGPLNPERQRFYFTIHGGLLLVVHSDGTYQVHNPATKQVFDVPKSSVAQDFNTDFTKLRESIIIHFPSRPGHKCRFIIVRFFRKWRVMEIYYSLTATWKILHLRMEDDLVVNTKWYLDNYVAFSKDLTLFLFILTNRNHGIAIKFKGPNNPKRLAYCFPLPEVVHGESRKAKLWECQGSLLLSYYTDTGLWIWKQPYLSASTGVSSWVWVPLLEISDTRKLCKPVAQEHLAKVVLDAADRVVPLASHPDVPLMFLLVKSCVFAYDLINDTLHRIAEVNDGDDYYRCFAHILTYKPCLSSLDAVKRDR